jgi:hypothetical protein
MANKKMERSGRKTQRGLNLGRKLNNPAKAGKRKPPIKSGPHVTNEWDRDRAMWLSSMGLSFYKRPDNWINKEMRQTS